MNERGKSDNLISETTLADGVLYRMPIRGECSDEARHAWKLIIISGAVTVAALVGAVVVIAQASRWTLMAPSLIPGFIGMLSGAICSLCVFGIYSSCDIRVTSNEIRVTDRLGILWWTRRRRAALAGVRIKIEESEDDIDEEDEPSEEDSSLDAVLMADVASGKPICLAFWYPLELLQSLAALISEANGVEFVDGERPEQSPPKRPVSSQVELTRGIGEMSIVVPASGMGEGSKSIVPFSILWLGCLFVFTVVALVAGLPRTLMWGGVTVFFCAIGLSWLFYGLSLTNRRMYFDVVGDTLLVSERRMFRGVRQHRWSRADIDSILVGTGSIAVNEENLYELCVRVNETFEIKSCKFLIGRDPKELRWIAYELRTALGLED